MAEGRSSGVFAYALHIHVRQHETNWTWQEIIKLSPHYRLLLPISQLLRVMKPHALQIEHLLLHCNVLRCHTVTALRA